MELKRGVSFDHFFAICDLSSKIRKESCLELKLIEIMFLFWISKLGVG